MYGPNVTASIFYLRSMVQMLVTDSVQSFKPKKKLITALYQMVISFFDRRHNLKQSLCTFDPIQKMTFSK